MSSVLMVVLSTGGQCLACCCVQFGQVGVVVAEMPMEGEASPGAESEARRAERGAEPQFTSGAGAAEGLLVRSPPFIGPESDHWLCLSVTHSLTNSLTD